MPTGEAEFRRARPSHNLVEPTSGSQYRLGIVNRESYLWSKQHLCQVCMQRSAGNGKEARMRRKQYRCRREKVVP